MNCTHPFSLIRGLLLMAICSVAHAYEAPIGIPDPSWGSIHPVDTQAPAQPKQWPNEVAQGHYYIHRNHPNATDVDNPNGFPEKPRKTIPDITYGPGSYVEIHGTYDRVMKGKNLRMNCTEAEPCWVRGTPDDKPIISEFVSVADSQYVFVENLKFQGGAGEAFLITAFPGKETHNVVLRHTEFRDRDYPGHAASAMSFYPHDNSKVYDVVAYANDFVNLGTNVSWERGDPDFQAMTPSMYSRDISSGVELYNVFILENYCTRVGSNCVQAVGQNCRRGRCIDAMHHIYVGKNVAHNNRQAGFWSKEARDIIFSQNVSYDNRSHGTQPGGGMGFQYGPDHIWFIYNEIYDSNYGIRQSSTGQHPERSAYFVGNLIYNIHHQKGGVFATRDDWREGVGISLWEGGMTRHVVNNTINDVNAGIIAIQKGPLYLSGNLISNIANDDYHISIAHPTRQNHAYIDAGLMFDPEVGTRIRWNWKEYFDIDEFKASINQCEQCLGKPAGFENAARNDFNLLADSEAQNAVARTPQDVYAIFKARYGLDIRVDFNRTKRPDVMSAGAFEFVRNMPSPAAPPQNVEVVSLK